MQAEIGRVCGAKQKPNLNHTRHAALPGPPRVKHEPNTSTPYAAHSIPAVLDRVVCTPYCVHKRYHRRRSFTHQSAFCILTQHGVNDRLNAAVLIRETSPPPPLRASSVCSQDHNIHHTSDLRAADVQYFHYCNLSGGCTIWNLNPPTLVVPHSNTSGVRHRARINGAGATAEAQDSGGDVDHKGKAIDPCAPPSQKDFHTRPHFISC
jgi:hypothetical protein